jgi:hypothetical protein
MPLIITEEQGCYRNILTLERGPQLVVVEDLTLPDEE